MSKSLPRDVLHVPFRVIELFEVVVDQLDVEHVIHAKSSHLNIVDLEEGVDRGRS